jgi:hypothetical protein
MYKLFKDPEGKKVVGIQKGENTWVPFAPDNTDYANFKKEVLAGAELQDADGNVMTQEQANQFVGGLA